MIDPASMTAEIAALHDECACLLCGDLLEPGTYSRLCGECAGEDDKREVDYGAFDEVVSDQTGFVTGYRRAGT